MSLLPSLFLGPVVVRGQQRNDIRVQAHMAGQLLGLRDKFIVERTQPDPQSFVCHGREDRKVSAWYQMENIFHPLLGGVIATPYL
jgi:hypothetical protein